MHFVPAEETVKRGRGRKMPITRQRCQVVGSGGSLQICTATTEKFGSPLIHVFGINRKLKTNEDRENIFFSCSLLRY